MKAPRFSRGDVLVPKGVTYPEAAIVVVEFDGTTLQAHREGGGFVMKFDTKAIKKHGFRKITAEEASPKLRRGEFEIESTDEVFPGWTTGHRWNGWATPAFDEETFRKILASVGGVWVEATQEGVLGGSGDEAGTWDGEEERIGGTWNEQLKETLYEFSGWCWFETDAAERAEHAAKLKAEAAAVPLASKVESLANEFSITLHRWFSNPHHRARHGEGLMDKVRKRNAAEKDRGICHSHDFVDANMAMSEAFEELFGREPDTSGPDTDIWNAAWDLAKSREFRIDREDE